MTARAWVSWIGFVLATMAACGADEHPGRSEAATEAGEVPPALRAAYVAAVQKNASEDHRVERSDGMLHARNAEQRLHVDFRAQGVEVTPAAETGRWTFELSPSRFGCERSLADVPPVSPEAEGNRVNYRRPGLHEWYLNGPLGLEQGFTITARPCAEDAGGGVVIDLGGGGDLRAEVAADGATARLLDAVGDEVLRYSDLYVVDATGRQLAAELVGSAEGLSIRIDDAGAAYPIEVDPLLWVEQQKLLGSDVTPNDFFGGSVAVSGDTAVVGAFGHANALFEGAAYVFVRSGTSWIEQQKLLASDLAPGDIFGVSVAIEGDTVVVGASGQADGQGAAYVFVRSGITWTEQQKLVASDGAPNDVFGDPVAISGDTVVVGARRKDSLRGAAYVFVRSCTTWTEQQKLVASDGGRFDRFGEAVAISGDTVVIGAPIHASNQGAAYVFVRSGTTWTLQQELVAGDGTQGELGESVGISGDTVVVGALLKDSERGAAYVFVRSDTTWTLQQKLVASDGAPGDRFGNAAAISGDTVVVGAQFNASFQGAAYVFVRSGTTWTEQQKLVASDGAPGDHFGASVAISGDTFVVGAPEKAPSAQGAAYVFVQIEALIPTCINGGNFDVHNSEWPFHAPGPCPAADEFTLGDAVASCGGSVKYFGYFCGNLADGTHTWTVYFGCCAGD